MLSYSWTEKITSTDNAGVITTRTDVHQITWADADIVAYNGGKAATEGAISDALFIRNKAFADYEAGAWATQAKYIAAEIAHINALEQLASAPALATIQANAQSQVYSGELQADADINAKALALALAPLFAGIATAKPVPHIIDAPGDYAVDANGGLLSMDAAHNLYQNGRRMGIFAARRLVVAGKAIMAQGNTVPSVWLWNGANWGSLPITDYDPSLFA